MKNLMAIEGGFVIGDFQSVVDLVEANIYWKDAHGYYLGCNRAVLESFELKSAAEIIGKNDLEAFSFLDHELRAILANDRIVLDCGKFEGEESFTVNGEVKTYRTKKVAFYHPDGKFSGIMGTSIDITTQKKLIELEKNKVALEEQLKNEQIIDSVRASIYWKDQNGDKLLGCNRYMLTMFGLTDRKEVVGKNEYDFISVEEALKITEVDRSVLANGYYEGEENFTLPSGENKTYLTVKNCLYDSERKVVGTVGTSIDITAQKKAEGLLLEATRQQAIIDESEKFKKEAHQVAHDIRSPLSTILMTLKVSQDLPEPQRVALRDAATRINDIANHLIGRFQEEQKKMNIEEEQREAILVSSALLEILTEKKYQYQSRSLILNHDFSSTGNFAWIFIKPSALKRKISNVINNAVDAFDGKVGQVLVQLEASPEQVCITIKDNGKGMSPDLAQKIKDKIPVTAGKVGGHGIGMTQVHDTLDANQGRMEIDSVVGLGTQIRLMFPRVPAQDWIADHIDLFEDDTVIVLDDDSSIHSAWDFRFKPLCVTYPQLKVIHHDHGQETLNFFAQLSPENKKKVFLLSDYELLRQGINGLEVIAQVDARRAVLVTSYYGHRAIQQEAQKTGTRILPKQLAADVPIMIAHQSSCLAADAAPVVRPTGVDAIFVDDDQSLLDGYLYFVGDDYNAEAYCDPRVFLEKVGAYPKSTKIFLDQHYANYQHKGDYIAEQLQAAGYTRLYLLTGDATLMAKTSDRLTVLLKGDLDALSAALEQ